MSEFTYEEASRVDKFMNDHMYAHNISNNINAMSCDPHCRTNAIMVAVRLVLKDRDE